LERTSLAVLSEEREAEGAGMCQSCIDIDKAIEDHKKALASATDPPEIERINQLIAQLYRDRVLLHKNPQR
jgi:hypothetical protein